MKLLWMSLIVCSTPLISLASTPTDVQYFIERRDGCDHFRGEYPYDEERGRFIAKNLKDLCTGTDKQLKKVKEEIRATASNHGKA
ncbi:hypothetical protein [Oxalicibacterium faecigallinarum]|nr:hypothetical protein [Oxalicibacterium faecigallinarum]